MPRSVKLSWQGGAEGSGRVGRWRKKYKGKVYYFPGGRGKSDREAYDAAVDAWEAQKTKIDREAPRPHQRDHEVAIDQWEQVLAWCNRHGDRERAEMAATKLGNLRKRLAAPILRRLDRSDWYESSFDRPPIDQDPIAQIILKEEERVLGPSRLPLVDLSPIKPFLDWQDGSPRRIEREIWRDRLEVQKLKAVSDDESLGAYVERFLKEKENQAAAGEVSVGRHYALKLHLTHFQDWLGKGTAVGEIDGESLMRYHADLLSKAASKTWSRTTAAHYMTSVKAFVRWLWHIEAIPTLPRILDGKSAALKITKSVPKVVTFTKEEIRSLLADASDRTKLYIQLMLNCGMTQKDIADLLVSEVDWTEGRVIRKRSKTADCENVPTVNYRLWPETLRLLKQEQAADSTGLVLVNNNGNPIWSEEITKDGKYKKNDNVKNAFERLRKELKIEKPLKSLKKTSATLLRDNEKFSALASLFLGHAPQSMADKHYTQVPQGLLDQAVLWLGQEYGLIESQPTAAGQTVTAEPTTPTPSPQPSKGQGKSTKSRKVRSSRSTQGSAGHRTRQPAAAAGHAPATAGNAQTQKPGR